MLADTPLLATVFGEPVHTTPQDLFIPPDALRVFLTSFEGPLDLLLYLIRPILHSGKTLAADAVEYSPPYDREQQGARSAARLLWQIWQDWR